MKSTVGISLGAAIALAGLVAWFVRDDADAGASAKSVRLADLLDDASIRSPLTEISAAQIIAELRGGAHAPILSEGFEDFDWQAAGWPSSGKAELAKTEAGQAFRVHTAESRELYGWVLPAEPNKHYVFERAVRTLAPLQADFVVVETMLVERQAAGPDDDALRVHRAQVPEPDGSWQRGSVAFFTQPSTYAFTIVLRPMWRRPKVSGSGYAAWFDDLRLERLEPTPAQMVALLKGRSLAEGADPELGIEKHGQFPPLRELTEVRGPVGETHSYRYALYAPPPTELGFTLPIPRDAVLRFSASLSRETPPNDAARFEVVVRADGGEETIWSRTLAAVDDEWKWHEDSLDLSRFAGRTVELVLQTTAVAGHPHPVWGNPVVDVPPDEEGLRNVILIAVDTLRADRLSCYGYDKKTTPHIDALAVDGIRFDQVVANATWTCPSFASIFTGMVPSRHGVITLGPMSPVPASLDTLAERFRAQGWATHSIAYKAPLYGGGYEQGFDVAVNALKQHVRGEENLAEAMEWLESSAERRNFLFLHFDDPHQPFTQPAPFDRSFGEDPATHGIELPHSVYHHLAESAALKEVVSGLYDGEVGYVDQQIGAFLAELERRGLYEQAVIGFVSDHGEQLWEHGAFGHGGTMVQDEVARVPLIVKPAGTAFARDRVVATQVRAFDIMPTLLEMAGISVGDDLDAESLVPLLAPSDVEAPDRVAVTEAGRVVALRNRAWKYILDYGGGEAAIETLHDLRADPGEQADVAEQHPDVVERLRLQVLEYYMLRRPGQYLVAIDGATRGVRELSFHGVTSAVSFFGITPRSVDGDAILFGGQSTSPLVFVAGVELAGDVSCSGWNARVWEHGRYRPGSLAQLLREPEPGIHVFGGPPPVSQPESLQTLNMEQMKALREVGYVGDGPGKPR